MVIEANNDGGSYSQRTETPSTYKEQPKSSIYQRIVRAAKRIFSHKPPRGDRLTVSSALEEVSGMPVCGPGYVAACDPPSALDGDLTMIG